MIDIKDKSNCCGCYSCYNICPKKAIEMVEDEKGFKYPKIDKEKCINCGLCKKVCPIINNKNFEKEVKAYACFNKNLETRMNSSSGGIFSLIANYILDLNGIVFGAQFDKEYNVVHSYIENQKDLYKFQCSKYVQSDIGDTYKKAKEFLDNDKYVLFTGTPCQIEGLYKFLRRDYDKLYTQDFICHGVPSPRVWRKYLKETNCKYNEQPQNISFRSKDNSWQDFELKIQYKNNVYRNTQGKDTYLRAFLNDICLRESCYKCNFKKKNRVSDFTLADFWGIDNIDKSMNDDKGISLVVVNSNKGKELFEKLKENLEYKEVNFDDAIKYNMNMVSSVKMNKNREKFFNDLDKNDLDSLVNKYFKKKNIFRKIIGEIKRILGKVKRIVKKIIKK